MVIVEICLFKQLTDKERDHLEERECVIVVVMTQGDQGGLLAAKDEFFLTSDVWQPIVDCQALHGKPKIFIIQVSCVQKYKYLLFDVYSEICIFLIASFLIYVLVRTYELQQYVQVAVATKTAININRSSRRAKKVSVKCAQ